MKEITNRSALFVRPKDPFKKWAEKYNAISAEGLSQRLKENHVYLIDWTYDENIDDVIMTYYLRIFDYELLSWNSFTNEWPQNRSYELFREWFEVELCCELFDLETERIKSEKL